MSSPPVKSVSCPAVIQSTVVSPHRKNFLDLREFYYNVCGKNYGNGPVGQPAIDAIWNQLKKFTELHPECQKDLPQQGYINQKVDEATLAYFNELRQGGGFHFG